MKDDFKIEVKHGWYEVGCFTGEYSDREEKHEVVRANSREEAWDLYKRYLKSNTKNSLIESYMYNKDVFTPNNNKKDYIAYGWEVYIEPLKVITFKEVKINR